MENIVPIVESTVVNNYDSIVLMYADNVNHTADVKNTYHHYCGFYSKYVLPSICSSNEVMIDNTVYTVSNDRVIDWFYDGIDTIVTEKRLLYTDDELPDGLVIYNNDSNKSLQRPVGVICGGHSGVYPIQDGFKLFNLHLSNVRVSAQLKTKIIAYADRQFDSKSQLVHYLNELKCTNNDKCTKELRSTIFYKNNSKESQLTVSDGNGQQLLNMHFRLPVFAGRLVGT